MTAAVVTRIQLQNADHQILSANITMQKAARLLARDKVVIAEAVPGRKLGTWDYPVVLRLKQYVYIAYEKLHGAPNWSKRGVLLRDQRICAYCGKTATTIDHVHPKSKGGLNSWHNTVAACLRCNHKKGNRTPEEAGMPLLWQGYSPKRTQIR